MNPSILVITCICTVLLFALVLPVSADDASTVTVTPIATITSTPAPGFDPLGSLESILGLRHEDRNLTQDISANDQDIHQNWWDNLNIFQDILGNRATVREDQSTDLQTGLQTSDTARTSTLTGRTYETIPEPD